MFLLFVFYLFIFQSSCTLLNRDQDQCTKDTCSTLTSVNYYFLYDVNPGEGFNLRRDVYVRMANLVQRLREQSLPTSNWTLVLPPWGPLYHWFSRNLQQTQISWSSFFDITSLSRFIPVIEFEEFLRLSPSVVTIPYVYTLQHFSEGWGEHFEEKLQVRTCNEQTIYEKRNDGFYYGWFFGYEDRVRAREFQCLSAQGFVTVLTDFVLKNLTWPIENEVKSVMFERAETLLHVEYGRLNYWKARRSMRYAKRLINLGKIGLSNYSDGFLSSRQSFSCGLFEFNRC